MVSTKNFNLCKILHYVWNHTSQESSVPHSYITQKALLRCLEYKLELDFKKQTTIQKSLNDIYLFVDMICCSFSVVQVGHA